MSDLPYLTERQLGLVRLRRGDVVIQCGRRCVVTKVTDCCAWMLPETTCTRVIHTRFDGDKVVAEKPKLDWCAANVPPEEILERNGERWADEFLVARKSRRSQVNQTTNGDIETTETEHMADNAKARGGLAAEARELKKRGRKPKSDTNVGPSNISYKGRGALIGKLVEGGGEDGPIWDEVKAKYPYSTKSIVLASIKAKRIRAKKQQAAIA